MAQEIFKGIIPPDIGGAHWLHDRGDSEMSSGHQHAELEVNLAVDGEAVYLIDGVRYDLRPGTLLWLFPAQDHLLISKNEDFTMWIAVFRQELLEAVCTDPTTKLLLGERFQGQFCKQLPAEAAHQLGKLFNEMLDFTYDTPRYNIALAYAALSCFSAHRSAADVPKGSDLHPAVEKAARLLRDDVMPMSVPDLARKVNLSPAHLSRLFRRQTGQTLVEYRQQRQLDRFLKIYRSGRRHNMLAAALLAGFGCYGQFHRVFKKYLGLGPADYYRS